MVCVQPQKITLMRNCSHSVNSRSRAVSPKKRLLLVSLPSDNYMCWAPPAPRGFLAKL